MTQQIINTGSGPDSYTGDTLRTAFTKVNDNFSQLYAGNVGGNITVANVTASGNVTADYFFGDGSNLTGIVATSSYGDANVAAFLPYNSANVAGSYFIGNGALLTGIAASSTYSNTNVAAYLPVYSGNVNAAYFTGNGALLTGITTTANLGNLSIGGATGQSLIGTVPGALFVTPHAGNAVVIQTEFDASGITNNLVISSFSTSAIYARTGSFSGASTTSLVIGANTATIQMSAETNTLGLNIAPSAGYTVTCGGSVYATEYYASANFPTGYQFTTPNGDTGLSHDYEGVGNVSVLRLRHDNATPAKFYENNTTLLSGNLVVVQDANTAGTFPNAFVQTYSNANTYTQFVWQNLSNGGLATGDIVITADAGTDTSYYLDMGVAGSGYDNSSPDNSLGTSIDPLDSYIYAQGSAGNVGGNLTIGTTITGTEVKVLVGGVDAANVIAKFTSNGLMPGANVTYSLGSSTQRWKDLWLSNSTLYLGDTPITATNGTLSVNGSPVSGSNYSNTNVAAYLPTYTGNIGGNISFANGNLDLGGVQSGLFQNGQLINVKGITGLTASSGATISGFSTISAAYFRNSNGESIVYDNANVAAYLPTYTGNIAANIVTDNNIVIDNREAGVIADITLYSADNIRLQGADRANAGEPEGGDIELYGGNGGDDNNISGATGGGDVVLRGGFGGFANTISGGFGGTVDIIGGTGGEGSATAAAGAGGGISITAGDAGIDNGGGGSNGGGIYLTAGDATDAAHDRGSIVLTSGEGGDETSVGGYVQISIPPVGTNPGGNWTFTGLGTVFEPPANAEIFGPSTGNLTVGTVGNTIIRNIGGVTTYDWVFDPTGNLTTPGSILTQNIRTVEGTVHVGQGAGLTNQGTYAIAMGRFAGSQDQGGAGLAIGQLAGQVSQGQSAIALGLYAAADTQSANAVAIGTFAGRYTQGQNTVAIGVLAGNNSQGGSSVAVGGMAGTNTQGGNSVAVGVSAGERLQGNASTALGYVAGQYDQGNFAVAVGTGAAYNGQGDGAIAIGADASPINQGDYSIAIGAGASVNSLQPSNSIIIDATSNQLAATGPGLFVAPVRNDVGNVGNIVAYNTTTKEFTYANTISITGNITASVIKTTPVVFSSLPSASDAGAGARAFITDANTTVFGAQVSGGGGTYMPVFSNGVNWYVG